jgi:hypothetical protein
MPTRTSFSWNGFFNGSRIHGQKSTSGSKNVKHAVGSQPGASLSVEAWLATKDPKRLLIPSVIISAHEWLKNPIRIRTHLRHPR